MTAVLAAACLPGAAVAQDRVETVQTCANASGLLKLVRDDRDCAETETSVVFATGAGVMELQNQVKTLSAENVALKQRVAQTEENTGFLQKQTDALEPILQGLESLLEGVSRIEAGGRDTLRFSGMNLQLVNGVQQAGAEPNGLGNLILGWNAQTPMHEGSVREGEGARRSGSHYLIVGDEHQWTGNGGIVAGLRNMSSADWASVLGGSDNTASAPGSAVLGGAYNTTFATGSVISGGTRNITDGDGVYSSILGGLDQRLGAWYGCFPRCWHGD